MGQKNKLVLFRLHARRGKTSRDPNTDPLSVMTTTVDALCTFFNILKIFCLLGYITYGIRGIIQNY